jgi:hypothetical protein
VPDTGFELAFELDVGRPPEDVFALLIDQNLFRLVDPAMIDHGPPGP